MVIRNIEGAAKAYEAKQAASDREQLILDHIEYTQAVLSSITSNLPANVDKDNLNAAGLLGLTEAAHSFDESRGVNFKSFAFPRIRGAVIDELRRISPLPQKMMSRVKLVRDAIEWLTPPVTPEAIADATGLTVDEVEDAFAAMKVSMPQGWDEIGGFAVTQVDGPDAQVEKKELVEQLADAIEQLPNRERMVLTMYYMESMLLKEIGVVLGISESRTSRVLASAEFRLKQKFESMDTRDE